MKTRRVTTAEEKKGKKRFKRNEKRDSDREEE
jgi:hypothetical protein